MTWKLLRAGQAAYCRCGHRKFVEVGPDRVMWFGNLPNGQPVPKGLNLDVYTCPEKRCDGHRRYLGIGMPANQVAEPPQVAA